MTDAPKIDTQAPDTSREYIQRMIACAPFADQTAGIPEMVATLRALLSERDLADARAAAAAQAMRDTEAIARRMMRVEVMENGPFHEFMEYVDEGDARTLGVVFANGKGFHYHSDIRGDEQDDAKVELLKRALDAALPLPDPAALDRLIAERVREAVEKATRDEIARQRANADSRDAMKRRLFPDRDSKEGRL
ncbi:hypothetical protein [Paracoccus sp. SY]|uniref:hypothetical protein n=1 Tax=Paracoccus sp. SY TaxID=1330255 RepID=UPI000CD1ECC2|nr:hypothetical protein [Paracoccus sp. SY]